jgi:hypothetical protein
MRVVRHPDMRPRVSAGSSVHATVGERRSHRRRRRAVPVRRRRNSPAALLAQLAGFLTCLLPRFRSVRVVPRVLKALELALALWVADESALASADDEEVLGPVILARVLPESEPVPLVDDLGAGVGESPVELLLHHDHAPGAVVEPVARGVLAVG